MQVFYFCDGNDPQCTKDNCYVNGGQCEHTIDRGCAKEMEYPRLFEELEPGVFFEIDPDKLAGTLVNERWGGVELPETVAGQRVRAAAYFMQDGRVAFAANPEGGGQV